MQFEDRYQDGTYLQATGDWHEDGAEWKARHVHRMIAKNGLRPKSIADVGCGTGGILVQLQSLMPDDVAFSGYELAKPALEIAKGRENERLHFANVSATDIAARHDLALVLDVFEHVPDYLGFLRDIGGIAEQFIFHIPLDLSMRCVYHDTPMARRNEVGHLHYFTTSSARATLLDCGYRVVDSFHTHAAMQPWPESRWTRFKRLPDRWLFKRNPDLCAKILGGCSWLVLAERA